MEQWDCPANQSHSGIQTDGAATISTVDCHHASGLKKKKKRANYILDFNASATLFPLMFR